MYLDLEDVTTMKSAVYHKQLVELNNYMFTTASTNYPDDPTLQAMFVTGLLKKNTAIELARCLTYSKLHYMIQDVHIIDFYIDPSVIKKKHLISKLIEDPEGEIGVDFIFDMQRITNKFIINMYHRKNNPVVNMDIEDPVQNLFKVILNCMKKNK